MFDLNTIKNMNSKADLKVNIPKTIQKREKIVLSKLMLRKIDNQNKVFFFNTMIANKLLLNYNGSVAISNFEIKFRYRMHKSLSSGYHSKRFRNPLCLTIYFFFISSKDDICCHEIHAIMNFPNTIKV